MILYIVKFVHKKWLLVIHVEVGKALIWLPVQLYISIQLIFLGTNNLYLKKKKIK